MELKEERIRQCPACDEVFGSNRAFDLHRVGTYEPNTRRCVPEVCLPAMGLVLGPRGWILAPYSGKTQPSRG